VLHSPTLKNRFCIRCLKEKIIREEFEEHAEVLRASEVIIEEEPKLRIAENTLNLVIESSKEYGIKWKEAYDENEEVKIN
jgi:hypothetical protein